MSTNDTMMTNEKEHSQQQQQQQQQQQEEEEEEENINKDHGKDTDTDTGRLVVVVVKEEEDNNNFDKKTFNYFAIGSMINPIAIKLRGINPITTVPAELVNHHISFFSTLGIAEPIENNNSIDDNDETANTDNNTIDNDTTYPTTTMHGVIHTLTADDMKRLDYIENENHTRVNAIARLYDGTEINVTVYKRNIEVHSNIDNDNDHTNSSTIPYERYIDIMIDGCIHYGVKEQYINYLRQHDKLPRPTPDEYLSFGLPDSNDNDNVNFMTIEQVIANDGLDGRPLYSIINNKVIVLSTDIGLKDYNGFIKFRQRMGYYNDLIMAKMVYDPKYGIPTTIQDFTPDHAAYCEHNLCHYYQMRNFLQFFKPIAWLKE